MKIDKNILNNIFLNEKYYKSFFNPNIRSKRIKDLYILSNFYKKHNLYTQKKDYNINKKLLEKWINSHKTEEDKKCASMLIEPVVYVSYKTFNENLLKSTNKFNNYIKKNNIKKYYLIIGATNAATSNIKDYVDIGKSNFWTLLMILPYLKIKPYDIVLNLTQAIEFSIFDKLKNKQNILDFVFVDDASYSGSQLFYNTIGTHLFEKYFYNGLFTKQNIEKYENNGRLIKTQNNNMCFINIHIIIPYLSITARDIGLEIQYNNNINIILHNNYFINDYKNYYKYDYDKYLQKMNIAYGKYGFRDNLIPLYFAHKMPDSVSTIDYILLSGIVSNYSDNINNENKKNKIVSNNNKKNIKNKKIKKNKKVKYIQFIDNCIYPKNKIMKPQKINKYYGCNKLCPIAQSKIAKIFIEKYLKKYKKI